MDNISSSRPASKKTDDTDDFRRGLKDAVPIMAGFAAFALVLGAQAAQKGFLPFEVPLMTGLNFGGGSEFAAVSLWTTPPHVLLIVAVTLLVNSRHLLMGAILAPLLQRLPRCVVLPALFFMCDESWAMGLANARQRAKAGVVDAFCLRYYLGVSLGLYVSWVVSTAVGAALGPLIGDVEVWGFQMAFPAVFLVLLRGMWKGLRAARPWMASLAVAAATYLMLPGAWYVVAGALSGLVVAWFLGKPS